MKVCHTLICFFLLSLQEHTGLISALTVYAGTPGGDVTVKCPPSSSSDDRKVFCKEECKQEDILINTTDVKAQSGRYSVQRPSSGAVSVTITQLTESDSGMYSCGVGNLTLTFKQIEIVVVDAQLDTSSEVKTLNAQTGGNITVQCFFTDTGTRKYFCKDECKEEDVLVETTGGTVQKDRYSIMYLERVSSGATLYVSIRQLTQSDSGRYRCGLDGALSQELQIVVIDASTTAPPVTQSTITDSGDSPTSNPETTTRVVLMIVVGVVVSIVNISVLVLTIVCVKRNYKPDGMNTRGNSDAANMELPVYDDCHPVSAREDSTYQSLDPATRDQNQTYSTLTYMQHK